MADGWNPVGVPLEGMAQMMDQVREMAKSAQRDPSTLQFIVRANLYITEEPIAQNRSIFTGTLGQIKEDIEGCRRLKADEIFVDPVFSPDGNSLDRFLRRMEQLRGLV
jgi:hypothetical protein